MIRNRVTTTLICYLQRAVSPVCLTVPITTILTWVSFQSMPRSILSFQSKFLELLKWAWRIFSYTTEFRNRDLKCFAFEICCRPRERRYLIDNSTESSELSFILDTHDYDYVVKNHSFGGLKVIFLCKNLNIDRHFYRFALYRYWFTHQKHFRPIWMDVNFLSDPEVQRKYVFIQPTSHNFLTLIFLKSSVEVTITGENVTEDATASPQNKKKCTDDEERNGRFSISFSESACIQKCANRVIRDTFHCEPYFFLGKLFAPWLICVITFSRLYSRLPAEARMPFCDSISTPKIRDTFSKSFPFSLLICH